MKNSEQMDSMSRDLVSQFKFHHLVTMIPTCNVTKRWQFLDVLRPIRCLLIIRKKVCFKMATENKNVLQVHYIVIYCCDLTLTHDPIWRVSILAGCTFAQRNIGS